MLTQWLEIKARGCCMHVFLVKLIFDRMSDTVNFSNDMQLCNGFCLLNFTYKKPTFKNIQQHLQEKYKTHISYGSVVQLCNCKEQEMEIGCMLQRYYRRDLGKVLIPNITQTNNGIVCFMLHSMSYSTKMEWLYEHGTR